MQQHIILTSLVITLQILAIHVCFWDGNIFSWFKVLLANEFDRAFGVKASKYVQKPLFSCLTCMSGIWTIILSWSFNVSMILIVCGMCALIDMIIGLAGGGEEI